MYAGRLGSGVKMHSFVNASHLGILRDDRAVPYIVDIITKPTQPQWLHSLYSSSLYRIMQRLVTIMFV